MLCAYCNVYYACRNNISTNRPRYPEEVADRAWDNVGLLLANANAKDQLLLGLDVQPKEKMVLLTNDLSLRVAHEAVKKKASVIVAYRKCHILPLSHSLHMLTPHLQIHSFSEA